MTSREAAQHILDGIVEIIGFYQDDLESVKRVENKSLADHYQTAVDTLAILAAGLKSSIDQGEYGE